MDLKYWAVYLSTIDIQYGDSRFYLQSYHNLLYNDIYK